MAHTTYIALLRGINVGGHTVKMERLRGLFGELGLERVRSYIQTGNVFFESDEADTRTLQATIERHLRAALGYEVATCLRTVAEVEQLLARDPFKEIAVTPETGHPATVPRAPAPPPPSAIPPAPAPEMRRPRRAAPRLPPAGWARRP